MTPSFQERSELKDDGGTNPDEGRIGKENSVTPSFQERSELKDDGGTNPDEGRIGKGKGNNRRNVVYQVSISKSAESPLN